MTPILLAVAMLASPMGTPAPEKAPTPIYLGFTVGHELERTYGAHLIAEPAPGVLFTLEAGWTADYRINAETKLPVEYGSATYSRAPIVMSPEVEIPAHTTVRVGVTFRIH